MTNLDEKELESINGGDFYDAASKAFWIAKGSVEVSLGGVEMIGGAFTADPPLVDTGSTTFSTGMEDISSNM